MLVQERTCRYGSANALINIPWECGNGIPIGCSFGPANKGILMSYQLRMSSQKQKFLAPKDSFSSQFTQGVVVDYQERYVNNNSVYFYNVRVILERIEHTWRLMHAQSLWRQA